MEDESDFIGLGRIGMVEKKVDEVEGRCYSGGYWVHMVHKIMDEGATKSSFEKLHESSLFLFKTQAPLFLYVDRALPR